MPTLDEKLGKLLTEVGRLWRAWPRTRDGEASWGMLRVYVHNVDDAMADVRAAVIRNTKRERERSDRQ